MSDQPAFPGCMTTYESWMTPHFLGKEIVRCELVYEILSIYSQATFGYMHH